ncbi:MAG: DUF5683 domain-containing protein [Alistipes sp.]
MHRILRILLLLTAVMFSIETTTAQLQAHRSPKKLVRGGIMQRPDTLNNSKVVDSLHFTHIMDSLRKNSPDSLPTATLDSLARGMMEQRYPGRTTETDSLLSRQLLDSLSNDSIPPSSAIDTLKRTKHRGFFSDSMSLSKVCWLSTVLPGYGQVYNKQYWKLPVLYGLVGASLGMFFYESSVYKPLKRQYNVMTDASSVRTPELDALQTKMIRSNTRRQVYLFTAIGSYLYFLGDAAVNYSTNDVSHVKKATTLACICPGAGQIYNRSYWKVPFVVGGFAAMIYCIDWNNRGYQRFRKAYTLRANYDDALEKHSKDPETYPKPEASTDEFHGRYATSFLKNLKDNYRRNRDLCIIVTAGIYILQIVDAHVDAHLKDYDISDDLSMNIEPTVNYTYVPTAGGNRPIYGFNIRLNF